MKKKVVVSVVSAALVLGGAIAGTLAWLTDETDPVVNTFTVGNVDITLAETTEDYKMVPGYTIAKDPTVTVEAGSEDCYLFVKVEESENFDDFMTYEMADVWTALTGVDGVYYRIVSSNVSDQAFDVLKDDQVMVSGDVTKAQLDALTDDDYPTLTFTAYAIQQYETNGTAFEPAEAWAQVNP